MRELLFTFLFIAAMYLISCQKEIDWGLTSNKNGDLLYKVEEISIATNDTNTITFNYDPQRRLTAYHSHGRVNSIPVDLKYIIDRQANGIITRITETTSGPFDSVVYIPFYTDELITYAKASRHGLAGVINDSITFIYNSGDQLVEKTTYSDFIGTLEPLARQTFVYDASGNPTTITSHIPDGSGGFTVASVTTQTFSTHKNSVSLGEECYMILDPGNVAWNYVSQSEVNTVLGIDITYTITAQTFTVSNRPMQSMITITPQPPGYETKVTYTYQ